MSVSTHAPQNILLNLSGTTFADASMSAYPGTDRNGAYALFESATCWDHSRSQNSQMNLKLHPNAVKGIEGSKKLLDLTRSYMRKGGFHIQFNIVDSKVLKDAQKHPNNYRDLLVRVAGFTQYWVEIATVPLLKLMTQWLKIIMLIAVSSFHELPCPCLTKCKCCKCFNDSASFMIT